MQRALTPIAAAAALSILCLLLAPSVAFFDSGELAATAATLGVPHPTGFPLFNLAGHLLTMLPLGPVAMRVHLLGAVAAVAAVLLWSRCLSRDSPTLRGLPAAPRVAVGVAALVIPLLPDALLGHARSAEIYPLVWLVVGAAVATSVRDGLPRRIVTLGGLLGLATLLHAEAVLVVGALTALAILEGVVLSDTRLATVRALGAGVVLGALAAAGLAYLPLAAARMPAFSWGDLRSLEALWRHLSAASIREAFADRMGAANAAGAVALLWRQVLEGPGWLAVAALLGAARMLRGRRRALGLTALVMALDAGYTVLLNPMGLRDHQVGLLLFLGLGVLGVQGLWAGAEVWAAAGAAGGHAAPGQPGPGAVAGAASGTWGETWRGRLQRGATLSVLPAVAVLGLAGALERTPVAELAEGARVADTMLADVPPGALLINAGDQGGSACAWMQSGEGARPDSPCVPGVFARDRRMMRWLAHRTGLPAFAALAPGTAHAERVHGDLLAAWLRPAVAAGPVLWQLGNAAEDARVFPTLVPGFPWHEVRARPQSPAARQAALSQALAAADRYCTDPPRRACRPGRAGATWLAHQHNVLGARLLALGDPAAGQWLARAASLAPHEAAIANNLAVSLIGRGAPVVALALCEQALQRRPDYLRLHRTAARAAAAAGEGQRAVAHARAALAGLSPAAARRWLEGLARTAGDATLAAELRALSPTGASGEGRASDAGHHSGP